MIDTGVYFFRLPVSSIVPTMPGQLPTQRLVAFHSPEFIREHGEGWVPVSHQLTVISDSEVLLSVMLNREVTLDLDAEPPHPRQDPSPHPR
ncbi:hypothetical protein [Agromyces albus]|uniref:hypothetical protein n=1 Tax=Agromyces albus TaxID=205332 RepID=UPI002780D3AA|nr:hypothetical protein [Agromyces albus]MDQ0576462.1 hypothetical protein [Agromyces albus]